MLVTSLKQASFLLLGFPVKHDALGLGLGEVVGVGVLVVDRRTLLANPCVPLTCPNHDLI
jgi:hypothetical protein